MGGFTEMEKWEYQAVMVSIGNINGGRSWVANTPDSSRTAGFQNILNGYGEHGWELVSAVVEETVGDLAVSAERYRLFFKRRLL